MSKALSNKKKLNDIVDVVADYGADPTGVADSTAAIQNALNAATNVFIPSGTYKTTASLVVPSGVRVYGTGVASIIKLQANNIIGFTTGTSTAKTNISISDLLIDGGGQTTNVNTGYQGGIGIYGSNMIGFKVDNVTIQNMGIVSASTPTVDNGIGGYGIIVEARYGNINNIRISRCTVKNIAGGGNNTGDGIYIAGYAAGAGTSYVDVVVQNCWASTCGRHCYTVAGGGAETTPSGVKFINCYGEKSSLDGVDIEEGHDVIIDACTFNFCGNDQTYYNPAVVYGSTYRLLAGVATSSASNNITISNSKFLGCYYGVTEGAGNGLIVANCVFESSTVSDFTKGLAAGTLGMKLIGCKFNTALDTLAYYQTNASEGFAVIGCVFAGTVKVAGLLDGVFQSCVFKKGFAVTGGSNGFSRNKFIGCTFTDWAGVGLQCDGASYGSNDVLVESCVFYGTGNMTSGISFAFNSANRWKISGCKFVGLTTAGINHGNGNAIHTFDAYDNDFLNCAAGILINQAINDSVISGNTFTGVTGYCISITNINSGAPMRRTSLLNNVAASGCTNGVTISVSTGTYDFCVIMGNNMNGATTTKWSLSAGNASGVTANNITI